MAAGNITKGPQVAHLDEYGPIWEPTYRHACLKKYVRPRLGRKLSFVRRIVRVQDVRSQLCFIIRSNQDNDRLRQTKSGIEDLTYIGRRLPRSLHGLRPFQGVQSDRSEESEE